MLGRVQLRLEGSMSEKHRLLAQEEKCCYLTSAFIELDGLEIPS